MEKHSKFCSIQSINVKEVTSEEFRLTIIRGCSKLVVSLVDYLFSTINRDERSFIKSGEPTFFDPGLDTFCGLCGLPGIDSILLGLLGDLILVSISCSFAI